MNAHVKTGLILVVLGAITFAVLAYVLPIFQDRSDRQASDARGTKGTITIGVDNFIGYFPLCSPDLKKRMRQSGYLIECVDDSADYAGRFAALEREDLDLAVATVDSYVLNGASQSYPGVILAVIDESKGGDAIVAWSDRIKTLDDLRSIGQEAGPQRIAFTPDSPSHHLLKSLAVHFDIAELQSRSGWALESNGSEAALTAFLNREADAAVLWEPDVSRALQQDSAVRILGTEKTSQLIVDILIGNRRYVQRNPEVIQTLLKNYFRTLKHYKDEPGELRSDIEKSTGLNDEAIKAMLEGIAWQTLTDNANTWFGLNASGLPQEALVDTIDGAIDVLINFGSMDSNPLPNKDPYWLTNSDFIENIHRGYQNVIGQTGDASSQTTFSFDPLTENQWNRLIDVGTLKIVPIVFGSGSDQLTLEGKEQLDKAAENLKHYPAFRVAIRGHTSTRGEPEANRSLSQSRAESVKRYLMVTHNLTDPRLNAEGYGGTRPLARKAGESSRAYNYRLPRVELVLVAEEL